MILGKAMNYNIKIEPSANKGFIVSIGCCRVVYENKARLLSDLSNFLDDPAQHEKYYNEIFSCDVCDESAPMPDQGRPAHHRPLIRSGPPAV